ncbi:MAG: glycosyltransferase family 2 protein [Candidatus Magasanikbacteria bacterium]|nr:glycosyltransferase family 2 protein [Candidatus Magasanikbacteria bacterium]
MISVLIPVYNEKNSLKELHERLVNTLEKTGEAFEIVFVDDGSTDGSREILSVLSPATLVLFSKNFGQNAAVDAGFQVAIGDYIITMDSDLQQAPEDILLLYEKLREGYGAVVGRRRDRKDSFSRRVFSRLANWLVRRMTDIPLHDFSCSLKGYRREFVDGVQLLGETFIFMPIFAHHRGANVVEVPVSHFPRKTGESKHKISEMIFVFFDLLSVKFLLGYFAKPLRFFGVSALGSFVLGLFSFAAALALKIMGIKDLTVTPLPLIGTMFVILSVLLFMLGLVTEILLRIYYEQKDHSQYMIYEVIKNK